MKPIHRSDTQTHALKFTALMAAVAATVFLAGCGGGSSAITVPVAPTGLGTVDVAPVANEAVTLPYVDNAATNQRGDARYATKETNAGVRVVAGFLDLWSPTPNPATGQVMVDAGVGTVAANGAFPGFSQSTWSGIPGDASDGAIKNANVLNANIQYVASATAARTAAQEVAAYEDDRRGKGYSVTDGLGPLTSVWRAAAQQTTTINGIPANAGTVSYNDAGNNTGVGGSGNAVFGGAVDFVNNIGENGSTEPAKRYFKYARPYRWSNSVVVAPSLVPVKSSSPSTDSGYISGHAAEATRDAIAMAYLVPERYQELISRGLELGENRILAGMHSPLDVMSGRIHAQAVAAASLATGTNSTAKAAAFAQARSALKSAVGASTDAAFNAIAHSQAIDVDRFADHSVNKANYLRRLTYGLAQIGSTSVAANVPKGAEVLLETRLPYLDAAQRRVVLKTTALASGYPIMDDAEGWGRMNLFAAADGYGAFNGDVTVTMNAAAGGFNAEDAWQNDIAGAGKLTKKGSGTLHLTGNNSYSGGTELVAGVLQADSPTALGTGAVYVGGGNLICNAAKPVNIAGSYSQMTGTTLQLNLGNGVDGGMNVGGTAYLGGTLVVTFRAGYTPKVGDMLNVIKSASVQGQFTNIVVNGFKVSPIYGATGLTLRIDA